jgi:ABC-2 type transport system permease protein
MRREGSPWQGLGTVTLKELADHLSSARMRVLEWLVILTAFAALYGAIQQVKDTTAEDPFVFLRLYTVARAPLPSFVAILGFLIPLMAIGLGFDAVNGEYNRRTMSRILSQPIYRDALLLGKFLAGLATMAISLVCLWLLVVGMGLVLLGVPPNTEEIVRSLFFLVIALAYAGVWLSVAILLSIVFRSPATAALVSLGLWLFLAVLWPMLAPAIAQIISPPDILGRPTVAMIEWMQGLGRVSPNQLFAEAVQAVLSPSTRSFDLIRLIISQAEGTDLTAPLPLSESLLLAWPQIVGLIAASIVLFVVGYVAFQRQEVRA